MACAGARRALCSWYSEGLGCRCTTRQHGSNSTSLTTRTFTVETAVSAPTRSALPQRVPQKPSRSASCPASRFVIPSRKKASRQRCALMTKASGSPSGTPTRPCAFLAGSLRLDHSGKPDRRGVQPAGPRTQACNLKATVIQVALRLYICFTRSAFLPIRASVLKIEGLTRARSLALVWRGITATS
jgi:hypothetical protein